MMVYTLREVLCSEKLRKGVIWLSDVTTEAKSIYSKYSMYRVV